MRCLFLEGLLLVSVTGDSASKSLKGEEEAIIRGAQGFGVEADTGGPRQGGHRVLGRRVGWNGQYHGYRGLGEGHWQGVGQMMSNWNYPSVLLHTTIVCYPCLY